MGFNRRMDEFSKIDEDNFRKFLENLTREYKKEVEEKMTFEERKKKYDIRAVVIVHPTYEYFKELKIAEEKGLIYLVESKSKDVIFIEDYGWKWDNDDAELRIYQTLYFNKIVGDYKGE